MKFLLLLPSIFFLLLLISSLNHGRTHRTAASSLSSSTFSLHLQYEKETLLKRKNLLQQVKNRLSLLASSEHGQDLFCSVTHSHAWYLKVSCLSRLSLSDRAQSQQHQQQQQQQFFVKHFVEEEFGSDNVTIIVVEGKQSDLNGKRQAITTSEDADNSVQEKKNDEDDEFTCSTSASSASTPCCFSLHFFHLTESNNESTQVNHRSEVERILGAQMHLVNITTLQWSDHERDSELLKLSHGLLVDREASSSSSSFVVHALTLCLRPTTSTSISINFQQLFSSLPLLHLGSVHRLQSQHFQNFYSRTISSSGEVGNDLFAKLNIRGKGFVIGIADSGVDTDHCFFDDPNYFKLRNSPKNEQNSSIANEYFLEYNTRMTTHRKFVRYQTFDSSLDSKRDTQPGHGTHVAGTIAGNPFLDEIDLLSATNSTIHRNISRHHGFAPLAKLSFFDLEGSAGAFMTVNPITMIFDPARHDGAFVHSNSWGSKAMPLIDSSLIGGSVAGDYNLQASQTDGYVSLFNEFLPVFASGNDADQVCTANDNKLLHNVVCDHYSVISPSTAKNGLSIGSSQAPMQSWREADLGDFVVDVFLSTAAGRSGGDGSKIHRASFNAVKAVFGMAHASLSPPTALALADPKEGCLPGDASPLLKNKGSFKSKIAVMYRGYCHFDVKAREAQEAGAVMLLVINSEEGPPIRMGGDDAAENKPEIRNEDLVSSSSSSSTTTTPALRAPTITPSPSSSTITIPSVMISKSDGEILIKLMTLHSASSSSTSTTSTTTTTAAATRIVTASLREIQQNHLRMKNRQDLSGFSGRGPTRDMRYKPDLVAIGEFVHSAFSDGDLASKNCDLWASMGTSMATPQVAAAAVLVKEYLLKYYNRAGTEGNAPSELTFYSDTLKGLLILYSKPLTGFLDRNMHGDIRSLSETPTPNFEQGFGALRLQDMLTQSTLARNSDYNTNINNNNNNNNSPSTSVNSNIRDRLSILEEINFTMTDEMKTFYFANSATSNGSIFAPFSAVLTWIDPMSTPTASHAVLLIHDMDLIVDEIPSGRRFLGNKYDVNPPNIPDDRNNVERVVVEHYHDAEHAAALYRVAIRASRLTSSHQRVSLVVNRPQHISSGDQISASKCRSDLDCNNVTGSCHRESGVCLCSRGFRGAFCQIPPSVLPASSPEDSTKSILLENSIHPMQWQEFVVVPAPLSSLVLGPSLTSDRVVDITLRSMDRDGDPNVFVRCNDTARDARPLVTALVYCDDCHDGEDESLTSISGEVKLPRKLQRADKIPLAEGRSMFLSVTAGCCWQARYQLMISFRDAPVTPSSQLTTTTTTTTTTSATETTTTTSPSSAHQAMFGQTSTSPPPSPSPISAEPVRVVRGLVAPSFVTGAKVREENQTKCSKHVLHVNYYYEFVVQYGGGVAPSMIRFASPTFWNVPSNRSNNNISINKKNPFHYSCTSSSPIVSLSSTSCTAKFSEEDVKSICSFSRTSDPRQDKKILQLAPILEVEYYNYFLVSADFVPGAKRFLNCSFLLSIHDRDLVQRTVFTAGESRATAAAPDTKKSLNNDCNASGDNSSFPSLTSAVAVSHPITTTTTTTTTAATIHPTPVADSDLRNRVVSFVASFSSSCNLRAFSATTTTTTTTRARATKKARRDSFAMLPAHSVLEPDSSCFLAASSSSSLLLHSPSLEKQQQLRLATWLLLPRSISDFPVTIGIRFNVSLLQELYAIESAAKFVDVQFRDEATGSTFPCRITPREQSGGQEVEGAAGEEIILCVLGGPRNSYILSLKKLQLEIINKYSETRVPLRIKNVGVMVLPAPRVDGFSINDDPEVLQSDFALPPSSSSFTFNVVGSNLNLPFMKQEIISGLFNSDDGDERSDGLVPTDVIEFCPQLSFALQQSKAFLVPAPVSGSWLSSNNNNNNNNDDDDASAIEESYYFYTTSNSFGGEMIECGAGAAGNSNRNSTNSSSTINTNNNNYKISCELPSYVVRSIPCAVQLTLQINTARVLWGSSVGSTLFTSTSSSSSSRLFFPSLECSFMISGIESPGQSVVTLQVDADDVDDGDEANTGEKRVGFDILGEFDTIKGLEIHVLNVGDDADRQSEAFAKKQLNLDLVFNPISPQKSSAKDRCSVVSTSTKKARVLCHLNLSPPSSRRHGVSSSSSSSSSSVLYSYFQFSLSATDKTTGAKLTDIDRLSSSQSSDSGENRFAVIVLVNVGKQSTNGETNQTLQLLGDKENSDFFYFLTTSDSSWSSSSLIAPILKLGVPLVNWRSSEANQFPSTSSPSSPSLPFVPVGNYDKNIFFFKVTLHLQSTSPSSSSTTTTTTTTTTTARDCIVKGIRNSNSNSNSTSNSGIHRHDDDNNNHNIIECHIPSVWASSSSSLLYSVGKNSRGTAAIKITAKVSLWLQNQDVAPVYAFPQKFSLSDEAIARIRSSVFATKRIEFAVRPNFPAALIHHHENKPLEIVAQLTSPRFSPTYLSEVYFVAVVPSSFSSAADHQRDDDDGNRFIMDYCSSSSPSSPFSNSTVGAFQQHRFILLPPSLQSNRKNPIRFDFLYPCSVASSDSQFLMQRSFFVAACAKLDDSSPPFAIQLALLRPPRFTSLHVTTFEDDEQGEVIGGSGQETTSDGRKKTRVGGVHAPHQVISIAPVCSGHQQQTSSNQNNNSNNNNNNDNDTSSDDDDDEDFSVATLSLDRSKSIRLGVSVNLAIDQYEAKTIERLLLLSASSSSSDDSATNDKDIDNNHSSSSSSNNKNSAENAFLLLRQITSSIMSVSKFFFSSTSDCANPIRGLSNIKVDPLLTQIQVHRNSVDKTTNNNNNNNNGAKPQQQQSSYITFQFTAAHQSIVNAGSIAEKEVFPRRKCHLCVKWNSSSSSSSSYLVQQTTFTKAKTTTKIATALLGFCRGNSHNRNDDNCQNGGHCDVESSTCVCDNNKGRDNNNNNNNNNARGAWCERTCPTLRAGGGDSVCSSNGKCSVNGECNCNKNFFGPSCSERLQVQNSVVEPRNVVEFEVERTEEAATKKSAVSFHLSLRQQNYNNGDRKGETGSVVVEDNILSPSRQLLVSISQRDGEDVTPSCSVVFWYNQSFPATTTKSVLGTRAKSVAGAKSNHIQSPTFSSPKRNSLVPFDVISIYCGAAVSSNVKNSGSDKPSLLSPSTTTTTTNLVVRIEAVTDFYDGSERGCESALCAVVAIVVGMAGGALGFAGVHIALQFKNKNYKEHIEMKKKLILDRIIQRRQQQQQHRRHEVANHDGGDDDDTSMSV